MMEINPNNHAENPCKLDAECDGAGGGSDYTVGRGRPPLHTRWKPGQSGNPSGRRKGRRNVKSEIKEVMSKQIKVRDGETVRKLSLVAANVLVHGVKGAKGDIRSSGLILNTAHKMGLLTQEDDIAAADAMQDDQRAGAILTASANNLRQSETLFENLDLSLLSREEQIELSRLADVIDLGGDITALSTTDFDRVKHIANKGRGKDITPQ